MGSKGFWEEVNVPGMPIMTFLEKEGLTILGVACLSVLKPQQFITKQFILLSHWHVLVSHCISNKTIQPIRSIRFWSIKNNQTEHLLRWFNFN